MHFSPMNINDVVLITPAKHGDNRGYFLESFRNALFEEKIGAFEFVQENQSMSSQVGTVRGLHFQKHPAAQGKLVRCIGGALLDVAVDIRHGSPTYGAYVAVELSAENAQQLWIPPGFAHGFCTLAPDTIISYKVTEYYSPVDDRGLLWDDPELGITWPVDRASAVLSDKDRSQPSLRELDQYFAYTD